MPNSRPWLVFVSRSRQRDVARFQPGGIRNYLEPSRHYASFTVDDAAAVAAQFLNDVEARVRIAAEGRRAVLASHTWTHRAAQILRDLDMPVPRIGSTPPEAVVRDASKALRGALAAVC